MGAMINQIQGFAKKFTDWVYECSMLYGQFNMPAFFKTLIFGLFA